MNNKSMKWKVLFGGFFCYMFDAVDLSLLAMALVMIIKDLGITKTQGGLLSTATLVGIGFSSFIIGWFTDNYGRKKALFVSLLSFSILTVAIVVTYTYVEILVLRFFAGLGLGGLWSIISTYVNETWDSAKRGKAAAFTLSSFSVGAGFCFNFGRGLSAIAPLILGMVAAKYSLTSGSGLCTVFFFLAFIAVLFLPDTQKAHTMVKSEASSEVEL